MSHNKKVEKPNAQHKKGTPKFKLFNPFSKQIPWEDQNLSHLLKIDK